MDSDISLAVSTRMPYCPILTFEDDSTYLYAKHLSVSTKQTIYIVTDLCCCGAVEDSYKILPVINMVITFEQLFSCEFRNFFGRINKNGLLSNFDL